MFISHQCFSVSTGGLLKVSDSEIWSKVEKDYSMPCDTQEMSTDDYVWTLSSVTRCTARYLWSSETNRRTLINFKKKKKKKHIEICCAGSYSSCPSARMVSFGMQVYDGKRRNEKWCIISGYYCAIIPVWQKKSTCWVQCGLFKQCVLLACTSCWSVQETNLCYRE